MPRSSLAVLPLLAAVFLAQAASAGALWPTFKGSMSRSGYFNVSLLYNEFHYKGFHVLWTVETQLCISSSPAIGDVNGDGRPEVVFSSCDGHLYVVNGATGGILWNASTGGGFASPTIWDLDGDGQPEIVTLGSSGVVYSFNGRGDEEWEVPGEFIRGSVAIADVNGDGYYEVLVPSIDGSLYVIGHEGRVLYKLRVGPYPVSTPAVARRGGHINVVVVDGDSLVLVRFTGGGEPAIYNVGLRGRLVGPPALADLDGDGDLEAVVVSESCTVYTISLSTGRILGEARLSSSECYSPAGVGDVDGDGSPDIVVGSLQGLYVLSSGLKVEYSFPEIHVYTSSPIIADIDGDGRNEIIVGQESGEVDFIDVSLAGEPYQEIEWFLRTGGPIMGSAAVADVNGDGMPEVLIGSRDFRLYCIAGEPLEVNATTRPPTSPSALGSGGGSSGGATIEGGGYTPGPAREKPALNWAIVAGALAVALLVASIVTLATRT